MDSRPREEHDVSDFYDNLDETTPLAVFVQKSKSAGSPPAARKDSAVPHGSTTHLYTLNTTLRDYRDTHKVDGKVGKTSKINKALIAYGYRPASRPKSKSTQCYTRYHQALPSHPFLRYDMDEQDVLYLSWLNLNHVYTKISAEVFEIAMSTLEYEWYKLELRMSAVAGIGQDGRDDLKIDANFEKYGSDDGTGGVNSISEQRCALCNDLDCNNTNSIVYCDGCNIAVHQECYGVAFIPEGQWFCRRCMVNRGSSVTCAFCPSKTGAFKQLDNGMWSHVVCALWIQEVYFANPVYLEPIEGIASIPRSRWTLVCYICKQKIGACIQCVTRKCTQAYHVTCAKRAGLCMVMEKGVAGAVASNDTLRSYCDRHSPSYVDKEVTRVGIQKTRMFYRDIHSLSRKNNRLASERRQANKVNRFKWKTEKGTPIAPQLFVDVIAAIMKTFKVGEDGPERMLRELTDEAPKVKDRTTEYKNLGAALCRYWCLKREAKNGAPLVRILAAERELATQDPLHHEKHSKGEAAGHISPENSETSTPMSEKIEFGHRLDRDLQKLIHLNLLAVERQRLLSSQSMETFKMIDTAYFAFRTTGQEVMRNMHRMFQGNRDHRSEESVHAHGALEDISSDISRGKIWSALDTNLDVQRAFDLQDNPPTSGNAAKVLRYWNQAGIQQLENVEKRLRENIPFTVIEGLDFSLKEHNPTAILEAEDLSEIEEDPFVQSENREILRKFLL